MRRVVMASVAGALVWMQVVASAGAAWLAPVSIGNAFFATALVAPARAEAPPRPPAGIPTGPAGTPGTPPAQAPAASGPLSIPDLLGIIKPSTGGSSGSVALDAKRRAMLDRVSQYLSGVQTLVGDFVQTAPDASRSEGKFYIQKPGRVRFAYAPPNPIDVIADGQSVVVRNRDLNTQDPYMLSQTPLRYLLAERIDLLKDTNVVSVSSDDVYITVVIEENQLLIGTNRLMLMFGAKDFQLRQWTVTDPQGFDTTVALYNVDATRKPDPSLFKINFERMLQ